MKPQHTRMIPIVGGPGALMLSWEIRSYRHAFEQDGLVFFDHAIPSLAGYFRLLGHPVPAHVERAVDQFRYHRTVFVAPPWPEIYCTDTERRQTLDEAERTYDAVVEAYLRYGYDLVELPRADPTARLRFVLGHPTAQWCPAARWMNTERTSPAVRTVVT